MDMVGRFSSLFQGRTDFLGAEDGGCIRLYPHDTPVGMEWIYQGHLTGFRPPIGIYPVTEQLKYSEHDKLKRKHFAVKFGAVDIDFEDLGLAKNLRTALAALGIVAWVERSRSKGYHVWIFADDWVPAVLVRSALQVACEVVHYSPKEIFPKQTELADGSPGNYIRLPYPGALLREGQTRRVVLSADGEPLSLQRFLDAAWEGRVDRARLEQAASLAKPPKVRAVLRNTMPVNADVGPLLRRLSGLAYKIWQDGPLEGSDRSSTLYKLAAMMSQEGFSATDTFLVVQSADERWGKFSDRSDGESRIWEIVERTRDE